MSGRILLADDDRAIREALTRALSLEGYDVVQVNDGAQALAAVENEQPDAAILDVMMPNVDGLTVCRVLRAERNRLPVLMLTARTETPDRVAGLDAGADDYLPKPFDLDELLARLRALLRRARPDDAAAGDGPLQVADLLARFPAEDGFYVSQEAAAEAVRRRGMFNIVHAASGWKVDIIVKKSRSFSQREFARRLAVRLLDQTVFVASAEDTILTKLEWARTSLSERQLRDVSEILDVQGEALDHEYLASGLAELGLEDVMARARGPW